MADARPISDIHGIIRLATERSNGDRLYRGQSNSSWKLIPRIFRDDITKRIHTGAISCGFEPMLGHEFKYQAPAFQRSYPNEDAHIMWLSLMQHYGVPTRLLDWTSSILTAAWFAVQDEEKDAVCGSLSVLNSSALTQLCRDAHDSSAKVADACSCWDRPRSLNNKEPGPFGVISAADRLAKQAFCDFRTHDSSDCGAAHTCRYPVAIGPGRVNPRLRSQDSWFTIHPTPEDVSHARPNGERSRKDEPTLSLMDLAGKQDAKGRFVLKTYTIENSSKESIRHALGALGISRATIFPDLDGLGAGLVPELQRRFPSSG